MRWGTVVLRVVASATSSHVRYSFMGVLVGFVTVYAFFTVTQVSKATIPSVVTPAFNITNMSGLLSRLYGKLIRTPTCKMPVHNVYYVKVHKTASSTFVTLLYGLARHNNLTVFPVTNDPFPGTGGNTLYQFSAPKEHNNTVYNIFGEHYQFNARMVDKMMPRDTKYIATIRYPVSHLRSMFHEFRIAFSLGMSDSDPVEQFLVDPERYDKASYLKNYQSKYLEYVDGEPFETFIKKLKQRFHLIVIAEYFDESLVLLRRRFCWKFNDIIYTVLRAHTYKNKNVIPSGYAMSNHRKYSALDYKIYDYFVTDLMNSISSEDGFWGEFYVFKNIKENVQLFCDGVVDRIKQDAAVVYSLAENGDRETFDPAPWDEPFTVNALDCAIMKLRTRVHRNLIKVRQFPELCRYEVATVMPKDQSIKWQVYGKTLQMHPAYCSTRVFDGFSLDVLADNMSYMWD